ncbi:MAG: type II secretion system protein [Candidatus Eremiobacteraeota bacterium]|nr:type II secretion system protein [Candidatus Eremiobacteraeota bacterium]
MSLLELIVTMAIFCALLTAVVLIELGMRRSSPREDAHSQAFRAVMTSLELIRSEVEGAYVQPQSTTALLYYPSLVADARVPLGPSGVAEAQSEAQLRKEADGTLVRLQDGQRRVVSHLGQDGEFTFGFPKPNLLQIHLKAVPSELGSYAADLHLHLANQQ